MCTFVNFGELHKVHGGKLCFMNDTVACARTEERLPRLRPLRWGISKSAVTTWKKLGRTPKIDQLKKVADYFDVSLDYLMDETDDPYDWMLIRMPGSLPFMGRSGTI